MQGMIQLKKIILPPQIYLINGVNLLVERLLGDRIDSQAKNVTLRMTC